MLLTPVAPGPPVECRRRTYLGAGLVGRGEYKPYKMAWRTRRVLTPYAARGAPGMRRTANVSGRRIAKHLQQLVDTSRASPCCRPESHCFRTCQNATVSGLGKPMFQEDSYARYYNKIYNRWFQEIRTGPRQDGAGAVAGPLSGDFGTHKTVWTRFCSWLAGESP